MEHGKMEGQFLAALENGDVLSENRYVRISAPPSSQQGDGVFSPPQSTVMYTPLHSLLSVLVSQRKSSYIWKMGLATGF